MVEPVVTISRFGTSNSIGCLLFFRAMKTGQRCSGTPKSAASTKCGLIDYPSVIAAVHYAGSSIHFVNSGTFSIWPHSGI